MSQLFVRTLREDPSDAEVASHRWLVRAGYIRRVAPGIYSWLPLGLKVLAKVEQVVQEEMAAAGSQEVRFPALLPREPYEATGRWTEYGQGIFRLKDRKGGDYLLGPTHEEMFTLAVKDLCSSYKDLPLTIHQVQTKYRDEARPRAGLLRGREFVMKDAYSFDVDEAGLAESYGRQRAAYQRIFDRLGFEYVVVQAMSGAMGGSMSEEFLAVSPIGEDTFVRSPGGYAANVEAVSVLVPPAVDASGVPAAHVEPTPGTPTIATLVEALNASHPREDRPWQAADTLKNVLVVVTRPDGSTEDLAIGLPGDRDVDPARLEAQLGEGSSWAPFGDEDFARHPELVRGYIGPGVLGEERATGIRYLLDPRVVDGTAWVTGADQADHHVLHLVKGRDFTADGTIEVADVRAGDPAPDGSGPLELARGIEMGHIFALGTKYSDALGLKVLDPNGKLVPVQMGSYGVGITRAVAVVAEATCDDKGLCWPRALAPFDVTVVATGKGEQPLEAATGIAEALAGRGLDVLLDDRKASPGVKFADAEVLGVPTIVVVGRGLADGVVEVRDRRSGDRVEVAVESAVEHLLELLG